MFREKKEFQGRRKSERAMERVPAHQSRAKTLSVYATKKKSGRARTVESVYIGRLRDSGQSGSWIKNEKKRQSIAKLKKES